MRHRQLPVTTGSCRYLFRQLPVELPAVAGSTAGRNWQLPVSKCFINFQPAAVVTDPEFTRSAISIYATGHRKVRTRTSTRISQSRIQRASFELDDIRIRHKIDRAWDHEREREFIYLSHKALC